MVSCFNCHEVTNYEFSSTGPKISYNYAETEWNPRMDPSLFNPIDPEQYANINTTVEDMKALAKMKGLSKAHYNVLAKTLEDHVNIFHF